MRMRLALLLLLFLRSLIFCAVNCLTFHGILTFVLNPFASLTPFAPLSALMKYVGDVTNSCQGLVCAALQLYLLSRTCKDVHLSKVIADLCKYAQFCLWKMRSGDIMLWDFQLLRVLYIYINLAF